MEANYASTSDDDIHYLIPSCYRIYACVILIVSAKWRALDREVVFVGAAPYHQVEW